MISLALYIFEERTQLVLSLANATLRSLRTKKPFKPVVKAVDILVNILAERA